MIELWVRILMCTATLYSTFLVIITVQVQEV